MLVFMQENQELLSWAMAYCSQAERCVQDVLDKLGKADVNAEDAEEIVCELVRMDYINEQRYAAAFAHDKFRFNKWGKLILSTISIERLINKAEQTVFSILFTSAGLLSILGVISNNYEAFETADSMDLSKNKREVEIAQDYSETHQTKIQVFI